VVLATEPSIWQLNKYMLYYQKWVFRNETPFNALLIEEKLDVTPEYYPFWEFYIRGCYEIDLVTHSMQQSPS